MNQTGTDSNAFHLPQGTKLHNGNFVIGEPLGQGGCGITYRGDDINLRRPVAIKEFFPPGCTRSGNKVITSAPAAEYAAAKEQFLEEARALARFASRGIVNVLLVLEENNTAYMVMEFLRGKNLEQLVEASGPLPEEQAITHVTQMAQALAVVHQSGFIHRDIKPANAIVCEDGRVVLIDFGLNKKLEAAQTYQTRALSHAGPTGTEGYAPPEQYLKDSTQSIATDVYALGATLYFLVTGQSPVSAPERAMGAPFHAPANINPAIKQSVSDAIMQAMELKDEVRPQTMQAFIQSLTSKSQTPVPVTARPAQVPTNPAPTAPPKVQTANPTPTQTAPATPPKQRPVRRGVGTCMYCLKRGVAVGARFCPHCGGTDPCPPSTRTELHGDRLITCMYWIGGFCVLGIVGAVLLFIIGVIWTART